MADVFICPDCEQPLATQPDSMCASCTQWRVDKLSRVDADYQAWRDREEMRRMPPSQRFSEACADMAKSVERSRQQAQ